jgi:hypothetical protein
MSVRLDAVSALLREYRNFPSGRPFLYWQNVLAPSETPPKDWCGAFVLYGLHQAGLARDVRWIPGIGFASPEDLPITNHPEPGDLLYIDRLQHHAMVVSYNPETGIVVSVDGNQPGIALRERHISQVQIYSIQPFVDAWEQEFHWGPVLVGAAVIGAASWVWLNGVPRPIERGLQRLGV